MCAGEKGSYNWQVSGVWFCAVLRPSSPGEGPGHAAHHQREKSGHQTPKEGKPSVAVGVHNVHHVHVQCWNEMSIKYFLFTGNTGKNCVGACVFVILMRVHWPTSSLFTDSAIFFQP